jgi:hypothetical protein
MDVINVKLLVEAAGPDLIADMKQRINFVTRRYRLNVLNLNQENKN